eukprot:scaffold726_cov262-Pinguiococcus_pyrenoidosus.AAC.4
MRAIELDRSPQRLQHDLRRLRSEVPQEAVSRALGEANEKVSTAEALKLAGSDVRNRDSAESIPFREIDVQTEETKHMAKILLRQGADRCVFAATNCERRKARV